jgi:hypothetical protein
MKRRQFLKLAGAGGGAVATGLPLSAPAVAQAVVEPSCDNFAYARAVA